MCGGFGKTAEWACSLPLWSDVFPRGRRPTCACTSLLIPLTIRKLCVRRLSSIYRICESKQKVSLVWKSTLFSASSWINTALRSASKIWRTLELQNNNYGRNEFEPSPIMLALILFQSNSVTWWGRVEIENRIAQKLISFSSRCYDGESSLFKKMLVIPNEKSAQHLKTFIA